jgi:hypothetical protein
MYLHNNALCKYIVFDAVFEINMALIKVLK